MYIIVVIIVIIIIIVVTQGNPIAGISFTDQSLKFGISQGTDYLTLQVLCAALQ